MRIVYCGTPADAVPPLDAIVDAGHEVALVLTQPDRRRGRGSELVPSPVKARATDLGLTVRTPTRSSEVVEEVRALDLDLGVVVAFGQLLPEALLDATRLGFVNLHFSLLPRWRGAAPVERAVLAGDVETGACVMGLETGLDTGPVYAQVATPIDPEETAGELRARLVGLGTELLVETLPRVADAVPTVQEGTPTYAAKLTVEEFRIDPRLPAASLGRLVRAGSPRPGAWGMVAGHRVKVLRAHVLSEPLADQARVGEVGTGAALATGDGALVLDEVQPEGRAPMAGTAWLAGVRADRVAFECP